MTLIDLCTDMVIIISEMCPFKDRIALASTCKLFRDLNIKYVRGKYSTLGMLDSIKERLTYLETTTKYILELVRRRSTDRECYKCNRRLAVDKFSKTQIKKIRAGCRGCNRKLG
jgi:hypothetical protein